MDTRSCYPIHFCAKIKMNLILKVCYHCNHLQIEKISFYCNSSTEGDRVQLLSLSQKLDKQD